MVGGSSKKMQATLALAAIVKITKNMCLEA